MRETVQNAKRPTDGQCISQTTSDSRGGLCSLPPSGQSLKHEFRVYFDGGDSGDRAYGSWDVEFMGFRYGRHNIRFPLDIEGVRTTSNCSEYLALLDALSWLQSVKQQSLYRVKISGDSMLVIRHITHRWRCKCKHLQKLRSRVFLLLSGFWGFDAEWKPRAESVSRFGH